MTSAREQFGRTAPAYATSAVHARGADLELLARIVEPAELFVDVGTGAGHTLAALAPKFGLAIGLDPTPEMLRVARGVLAERGVAARLVQADVAALPFVDESIAVVTCRVAAHHFANAGEAFAEIARVLAPSGTLYLVDNFAPDDPTLDDFINTLERVRDPSHVREHTLGEWQELLSAKGLRSAVRETWRTRLEVDDWLARSQTTAEQAAEVRRRLREAAPAAVHAFGIGERHFTLLKALIVAAKTGNAADPLDRPRRS